MRGERDIKEIKDKLVKSSSKKKKQGPIQSTVKQSLSWRESNT